MIILDTNVVSEMMKPQPNAVVKDWMDAQLEETLWLSSVTVFEIACGIELLPTGKRKEGIADAFNELLINDFENRVLAFDDQHARRAGEIFARLRSQGQHPEYRDVQIAGIVAAFNAVLATRNTKHFSDTGVTLTNPWDFQP